MASASGYPSFPSPMTPIFTARRSSGGPRRVPGARGVRNVEVLPDDACIPLARGCHLRRPELRLPVLPGGVHIVVVVAGQVRAVVVDADGHPDHDPRTPAHVLDPAVAVDAEGEVPH